MMQIKIAMSKRKNIEKDLVERWLAYDQSVVMKNKEAMNTYRHDICLLLAYLLNTYLDADDNVDWCGTWADHLLDAEIDSGSSGARRASGLMDCGKLSDGYMHLTPFYGSFVCSTDLNTLQSYELCFAAAGPWDRSGTPLVVPYTEDKKVRHELRDRLKPGDNWATVYRSP
jgi:hypothetical protein